MCPGLRAERAAAYLGMGKTKFLELVDKGLFPKAVIVDGLRIWDRLDIDAAFEAAKEATLDTPADRNSFDNVLRLNK
jgi:predicted DNA-binding transcriptional regulator AlpA